MGNLLARPLPSAASGAKDRGSKTRPAFAALLDIASAMVLVALPFGITIASGPLGFVLLILITATWAVVFSGFMQLIALKTRSAAATNSAGLIFFPLLFLTPSFVPRDLLTRAFGLGPRPRPSWGL